MKDKTILSKRKNPGMEIVQDFKITNTKSKKQSESKKETIVQKKYGLRDHSKSDLKKSSNIITTKATQLKKEKVGRKKLKTDKKEQNQIEYIDTKSFEVDRILDWDQIFRKSHQILKVADLDYYGSQDYYNENFKKIEYLIKDKQIATSIKNFQNALQTYDNNSLTRLSWACLLFKTQIKKLSTKIEKETSIHFIHHSKVASILELFGYQ